MLIAPTILLVPRGSPSPWRWYVVHAILLLWPFPILLLFFALMSIVATVLPTSTIGPAVTSMRETALTVGMAITS